MPLGCSAVFNAAAVSRGCAVAPWPGSSWLPQPLGPARRGSGTPRAARRGRSPVRAGGAGGAEGALSGFVTGR